ncbi:discoidin domain-containing protein, partial [Streptomyces sp. SID14478]|uniref:discoidin domain-containing protein n=1 Tax=Streptomyces sp. SID14478 TaxID=2706073 RepID=UPI0013E01AD0
PLAVYEDTVLAADGPAAPLVVEGLPGASADTLRALARRAAPRADDAGVHAALTDGHLSLFNLTDDAVTTRVTVPQSGSRRLVFEGVQSVTDGGSVYTAALGSGSAVVLAPRFTLTALSGRSLPPGLRVKVVDGATLHLSGAACRLRVEGQGHGAVVTVRGGRRTTVTLRGAAAYPHDDLALGRNVFPTSPLPTGMSAPGAAVDGDPDTSWTPGPDGRMVVDLGAERTLARVEAEWNHDDAPTARVEFSRDGITYQNGGKVGGRGRTRRLTASASARYVALRVEGKVGHGVRLVRLSVR